MRILITTHEPLDESPVGQHVAQLSRQLAAAGHHVHLFVVDDGQGTPTLPIQTRVICHPTWASAAVPFDAPRVAPADQPNSFARLSDTQLDNYRDALREVLDAKIHQFDPHLVHAQHVWLLGHLALEAGVPYVLEAWGPEFALMTADPRWYRYAQQAAENAGRILAPSNEVAQRVAQAFPGLETGTTLLPPATLATVAGREQLLEIYRVVVKSRFGDLPID